MRAGRSRRWPGRAVAVLAATGLLAGCASIPGSGPVETGRPVDAVQNGPMEILAPGPQPGATPSELVRGFLQSAAAFNNDNETARQFLVTDQQLAWEPESSVVIYPSMSALSLTVTRNGRTAVEPAPDTVHASSAAASRTSAARTSGTRGSAGASSRERLTSAAPARSTPATPARSTAATPAPSTAATTAAPPTSPGPESTVGPRPAETATVTVTVPVTARINTWGEYTVAAPGETVTRTFQLIGTDAGWRIDSLADGILIDQDIFHSTFRALPVYFADVTGKFLVPDVRWFPVSGASTRAALVSSLVRDLLHGPSPWLRPGVDTGAPHGTTITLDAPKVADYVATVDLNPVARSADARHRVMLMGQLEQTLTSDELERTLTGDAQTVVPIAGVVVTVDQQAFEPQAPPASPPGGAQASPDQIAGPAMPDNTDTAPVGLDAKGAVVRLDPLRGVVAVRGLGVPPSTGNADPAVEPRGLAYAVLTAGRTRLEYAVPSGPVATLITGHELVAPTFDPFGWVWTAQSASGGVLLAARPAAGVERVSAPWLDGMDVTSLRISSDGARAVVVARPPSGVGQVWVSAVVRDAAGRPTALGAPVQLLTDAQDAIGAAWSDGTHVIVLVRSGGAVATPWTVQIGGEPAAGPPVQGQAISADDSGDVYVTTSTGTVLSRVGAGWQEVAGILWATMPG